MNFLIDLTYLAVFVSDIDFNAFVEHFLDDTSDFSIVAPDEVVEYRCA
jgi:hypothetical protein